MTLLSPIPQPPRSSVGFVEHAGKIYYIAGHTGLFHVYPPDGFTKRADRYDIATDSWEPVKDFPLLAQGFRCVAYQDSIYSFGGFVHFGDTDTPVRSTDHIFRLDIRTGEWEDTGLKLPTPRSSYCLGMVGNLVYFFGGWNGWAKPAPGMWRSGGKFSDVVDVLDLATMQFQAPLSFPIRKRRAFCSSTSGSKVILAGGMGEGGSLDLIDEVVTFDAQTGAWDLNEYPRLPKPRFSPGVLLGHGAYVAGGLFMWKNASGNYEAKEFNDVLSIVGGAWKPVETLSSSRTFAEVASFRGGLGVFGGHSGDVPTDAVDFLNWHAPGLPI